MSKTDIKTVSDEMYQYLMTLDPGDPEYRRALENLRILEETRTIRAKRFLTPDAAIGAVASVAGIMAILSFEHFFPVVTKALGFVHRVRF